MKTLPEGPITYLITPGEASAGNFDAASRRVLDTIELAVELGVSLLQIREKLLTARLLCDLVSSAAAITAGSKILLLVSDRADIARGCGADGVQLTSNSLPAEVVRRSFPNLVIGVSTHSAEEVEAAAASGADFALFGPVFATPGKTEQGLDALSTACQVAGELPVLAIGGIDEMNFREAIAAGASGFAAIRAMNDAGQLQRIMRELG